MKKASFTTFGLDGGGSASFASLTGDPADNAALASFWISMGLSKVSETALEYKGLGNSSDTLEFKINLNEGTSKIGEVILGFRGDGNGGGTAFLQGTSSNFRIEQGGGGLANLLANGLTLSGNLNFNSTTAAGLRLNNLTITERNNIASPLAGMTVWNTNTSRMNVHNGSAWTDGFVRLAGDTMTGPLGMTGGTVTASTPLLDLTQTWNNAGVTFVGHRLNVTDTNSAAASLLLNLQIGGNNKWSVRKDGSIDVIDTAATDTVFLRKNGTSILRTGSSTSTLVSSIPFNCAGRLFVNGDTTVVPYHFAATDNNSTVIYFQLMGEAADVMAQRRGTNGQTFRLYGTFTDASNHRRINLSMSTAGVAVLRAEGAGTGASGNVIHISSLPISNPGPGILWNNAGTPAIGTS
jgi:hypothetical protein